MRASGQNRFVIAKNTATRSVAKTSSLGRTNSISENRAEDDELLDEETEDCDSYDYQVLNSLSRSRFKDFSSLSPAQNLEETSFVRIFNSHNQPVVVKKSSVVWFLESGVKRLSNDRCVRVAQTGNIIERANMLVRAVGKQTINLGDWCAFKESGNLFVIGRVLSMRHSLERKKVVREWDYRDATSIATEVLCAWHSLQVNDGNFTGILNPVDKFMHEYYPCKFYLCSFPPPAFTRRINSIPWTNHMEML